MENASKALIIAGAIILGILIIGLGMAVFTQAREAITGANLDSEKAQAFNSKFMDYTGPSVTGVQLKSLIDLVISNDSTTSTTENPTITLKVTPKGGTETTANTNTALAALRNKIKNADRYEVTVTAYDTAGRITAIEAK